MAHHLEFGVAGLVRRAEHLRDRLVQIHGHAQAVGGAGAALRDAFGNKGEIAGLHLDQAEFRFDPGFTGKLEVERLEINVARELDLRAHHALDADALLHVLEHQQKLLRLGEHVERPEAGHIAFSTGHAAQARLMALRPGLHEAAR